MHSKFYRCLALLGALVLTVGHADAQRAGQKKAAKTPKGSSKKKDYAPGKEPYSGDIAFTFLEEKTDFFNNGNSTWVKGGSMDIGFTFFHGFGLGFNMTGEHAPKVVGPFDLGRFSYGVGPRYTFNASKYTKLVTRNHDVRIFGQFLLGQVHSYNTFIPYTVLPVPFQYESTNNSNSLDGGGGIDIGIGHGIYVRPIQASWIRMHVPDGNLNKQEDIRLSAGINFHVRPR